jgi:NAD(P)-dependent dehydrogenase (short-subunit alcohol dehydrogenase family)
MPSTLVLGAGPGLGLSVAHRFGREGHAVALVSRSATRHPGYLKSLADAGIRATAHTADVHDPEALRAALSEVTAQHGTPEVVYYGPGAHDPTARPAGILDTGSAAVRDAMATVYAAVDVVTAVLPGMLARGSGALLFAGGLSAVTPLPPLGALALSSAALRNYALTLHAALAERGLYAGTLTIGGLIARGDIHHALAAEHGPGIPTLDPDDLADTAWHLHTDRDRPEVTFAALP